MKKSKIKSANKSNLKITKNINEFYVKVSGVAIDSFKPTQTYANHLKIDNIAVSANKKQLFLSFSKNKPIITCKSHEKDSCSYATGLSVAVCSIIVLVVF